MRAARLSKGAAAPMALLLLVLACGADLPTAPWELSADRSGSTEGELCSIDEDCEGALVCITTCDDWCDQTVWPNPCCENACSERNAPWVCLPGGAEVDPATACPAGTVEPAHPEDWVTRGDLNLKCCLPDVPCEENPNRIRCEALPGCTWTLSGADHWNNDGTCGPRST